VSDGIRFDTNLPSIEARLEKLVAAVTDLRPFWPLVVPLYVRWMGQQFDSAGHFFGDGWEPLSADYAAWKSVHYPGRGILMAEGELRRAAQTPRREATPTMLTLSVEPFTKRKGRSRGRTIDPSWFQGGTNRMPARPLLPITGELTPTAAAEVGKAAEFYLADTARRLRLV
jgi:hypothetical protein